MLVLLVSPALRAQYNPSNPDEPGTRPWKLTLTAVPANAGYYNLNTESYHAAGEQLSLYAYDHNDYVFQQWEDTQGNILSSSRTMNYTMPAGNITLVARYTYSPDNPDEPGQASIKRHLFLRTNPEGAGWFNLSSDNNIATGENVNLRAYANQHYVFRNWTYEGTIISTSAAFAFTMPEKDATLVANYDYNYSPDNPNEPGEAQGNLYNIYGMRESALAGHTIAYPIYLQNRGSEVTGLSFNISIPEGFTADVNAATLCERAAKQSLEVQKLTGTTWRFIVSGAESIQGVEGKVLTIPIKVPATATVGDVFTIGLAEGVIFTADGTQENIGVRNGSVKIVRNENEKPDSPDYIISNIQTTNSEVMPQEMIHLSWQVKNQGNLAGYGGWTERIHLISASGRKVTIGNTYYDTETLQPGAVVTRSADIILSQLPGIDGDVDLGVTIVPSVGSGEATDFITNNSAQTTGTPLHVGKRLYLTMPQVPQQEGESTTIRCQLARSGNWAASETFELTRVQGDDRLGVPQTVTIPSEQATVYFYLTLSDNADCDEDSIFAIQVSGNNYDAVEGTIIVRDDERPPMRLTASRSEVTEGETFQLTVTVPEPLATNLVISLSCDHAVRFNYPKSITLPAGDTSVSTTVTALDDTNPDNVETVEFFATADGFSKANMLLLLNDNDVPEIDLVLTPDVVSENAGINAIYATLKRTKVTNNKVTVRLVDDKEGVLIYPSTIVLEKGETEKTITIGVVDNTLVEGECIVNITAEVFVSSCNCGVVGNKQGTVTRQLHILDDDGPTLSMYSNLSMIREGDAKGTVITLTRNTQTNKPLTVSLETTDDGVVMPSQVTIPQNQRNVTFVVTAKANNLQEGSRLITIRANAEGFNSGSVWLYVTDTTLPDMKVRSIVTSPENIYAGDEYAVEITISNIGVIDIPPRSTYTIKVADEELTMTIPDAIPSMEWKTVKLNLTAPSVPGSYTIDVECNKNKAFEEVQFLNNSMSIPLAVSSPYTFKVETDRTNYQMGETVRISGQVTSVKGNVAGITVEPYVICFGKRQALSATTDASGHFTTEYALPAGMGGDFSIGACMLGENATETSTTIHVYGMARASATYIKSYMYVGSPYVVRVPIKNLSSLPLHNIKTTVIDNAGHYEVTGKTVSLLGGNGEAVVELTMLSNEATTTNKWERVWIGLTSDEGATLNFVLYNYTNVQKASLTIDTPVIKANITNKKPTVIPVVLSNVGVGETGVITIGVPTGQDFFSVITPQEIPSLAHGDSATVCLQFNPAGLDVNVIQSGTIAINCEKADGQLISYNLKVVGEDKGNLVVRVEDEYTIYGDADGQHPYVDGAYVTLKDYNTGVVLFSDTTSTEGLVSFNNIPEGYYTLFVTATKHDSYIQNVLVSPGETTEHLATISYKAISISYNVEETTTDDKYEITSELEYETQVPVPVVTIDMPEVLDLYSVEQGHDLLFNITVTNHGLITANNVCVQVPFREGFIFTPLTEYAGFDLVANQSHTIPVLVSLDNSTQSSKANIRHKDSSNGKCDGDAYASWEWVCKADRTAWVGKVVHFLISSCPPNPSKPKDIEPETDKPTPPDPPIDDEPLEDPRIPYVTRPMSQIDLYGAYQFTSWLTCSMSCFLPKPGENVYSEDYWEDVIECMLQELGPHAKKRFLVRTSASNGTSDIKEQYLEKLMVLMHLDDNIWNYYVELTNASQLQEDDEVFNMLMPSIDGVIDKMTQLHKEGTLYSTGVDAIYNTTISMMPQQSADWYDFNLRTFIERQMNTFRKRDNMVVNGTNYCDIIKLDLYLDSIAKYEQDVVNLGFADRIDMIHSMGEDADAINSGSSNVCATVKMQLNQEMVFTRQAFRGTLTIENNTESDIDDIAVYLNVTDENGTLATSHEMQINLENYEGFTQTNEDVYSLEKGKTGVLRYLFIPTKYAAPEHNVRYSFGGSLKFDDGDGLKVRDLYPVSLEVKPSPELDLTYFMQRDAYGDDPLTEEVEPIVPSEFALIINNKGFGDATNVRMVTQQPQITENEKGLLINFRLISSQVNGESAVLNFGEAIANDFGTIPAKSQAYAQWWLTSTLLGHFIKYNVEATHVTSYGNEDLSLLDQVTIHELIHGFTPFGVFGDTNKGRGFLVNDMADAEDQPDEVYFTNGTQKSVVKAAGATTSSLGQNAYLLNITPATTGWNYGSLPDPTNGRLQLVSIIRQRDGAMLPADNIWQTAVTLRDGKDPVHENRLHFICEAQSAAETWVLNFDERPEVVKIEDQQIVFNHNNIYVTPLPMGERVFIKGNYEEVSQLTIYDVRGIKWIEKQNLRPGEAVYTGSLPTGVYHVKMNTDRGVYTQKVIKR